MTPKQRAVWQEVLTHKFGDDFETDQGILANQRLLAIELIEGEMIPDNRLRYFFNPDYNTGASKMSHAEIFAKNGTRGHDIYEHPHFTKYLQYFIEGADLPKSLEEFIDDAFKYGVDHHGLEKINEYLKSRKNELIIKNYDLAEEVYKALIDKGLDPIWAQSTRTKLKAWK